MSKANISSQNTSNGKLSLGNKENEFPMDNLYRSLYRKHISEYALVVGSTSKFLKEKKRKRHTTKKNAFNITLRFGEILTSVNKALCGCGNYIHYKNENDVELKKNEGRYRLKGLQSCGNNASCPVCAAKLSIVRSNQLEELMTVGRENDRSYIMVVATIPHKPNEDLEILMEQVGDMSSYIFRTKQWQEFKKITSCRFTHGGLENMVSFKNGLIDWHPHKNYILDFDIPTKEVVKRLALDNENDLSIYISNMLTSLGQRFLDKKGIKKKLLTPYFEQSSGGKNKRKVVKGGVTATLDFNDTYISKWGLSAEMTAGIYKDGRFNGGSFHPFGLLDLIDKRNKDIGEKQRFQCIKAFQEFVVASKGKWWFYFGRGAVAYYNANYGCKIKVKKDEEELQSLEDLGDVLTKFSYDDWRYFRPTTKKIYDAFTQKSDDDVIAYFRDEIEDNKILERGELDLSNAITKSITLDSGEEIVYKEIVYEDDELERTQDFPIVYEDKNGVEISPPGDVVLDDVVPPDDGFSDYQNSDEYLESFDTSESDIDFPYIDI